VKGDVFTPPSLEAGVGWLIAAFPESTASFVDLLIMGGSILSGEDAAVLQDLLLYFQRAHMSLLHSADLVGATSHLAGVNWDSRLVCDNSEQLVTLAYLAQCIISAVFPRMGDFWRGPLLWRGKPWSGWCIQSKCEEEQCTFPLKLLHDRHLSVIGGVCLQNVNAELLEASPISCISTSHSVFPFPFPNVNVNTNANVNNDGAPQQSSSWGIALMCELVPRRAILAPPPPKRVKGASETDRWFVLLDGAHLVLLATPVSSLAQHAALFSLSSQPIAHSMMADDCWWKLVMRQKQVLGKEVSGGKNGASRMVTPRGMEVSLAVELAVANQVPGSTSVPAWNDVSNSSSKTTLREGWQNPAEKVSDLTVPELLSLPPTHGIDLWKGRRDGALFSPTCKEETREAIGLEWSSLLQDGNPKERQKFGEQHTKESKSKEAVMTRGLSNRQKAQYREAQAQEKRIQERSSHLEAENKRKLKSVIRHQLGQILSKKHVQFVSCFKSVYKVCFKFLKDTHGESWSEENIEKVVNSLLHPTVRLIVRVEDLFAAEVATHK
jgi:hypothetical protein